jgi:hypothetical protein
MIILIPWSVILSGGGPDVRRGRLKCRFEIPDMPPAISSRDRTVRHNVIMAVKEAIHNVIKHARASEIQICIRQRACHSEHSSERQRLRV